MLVFFRSLKTVLTDGRTQIFRELMFIELIYITWLIIEFAVYASGYQRLIQQFVFLFLMTDCSLRKWDRDTLRPLIVTAVLLVISFVAYYPISPINEYHAFLDNSNSLGMLMLPVFTLIFAYFPKDKTMLRNALLVVILAVVFLTKSRTSLLALFILLAACFLTQNREFLRRRKIMKFFFFSLLIIILSFTFIYTSLFGTALGDRLNDLSMEKFGKNLFSGRHILWRVLLDNIAERPLFGFGCDTTVGNFTDDARSGHNLYLQTTIQTGIIGTVILILLIYFIYRRLLSSDNSFCLKTNCFILALLFRETFEVSLTQNNWPFSITVWMIMGIALSLVRYGNAADISPEEGIQASDTIKEKESSQ